MTENTAYIQTFGCQMNEHDTKILYRELSHIGFKKAETAEEANLVILNTCSIREKAVHKVFSRLGALRKWKEKKENGEKFLGVCGCVAESNGEEIMKKNTLVDFVIGPRQAHRVAEHILALRAGGSPIMDTGIEISEDYLKLENITSERIPNISSWVTIMTGCGHQCTYCIVPSVRGDFYSYPSGRIRSAVRELARQGIPEIYLLGQNINAYGLDMPGEISFFQLLKSLDSMRTFRRIRFTTSHPVDLSPELMLHFSSLPSLAPFLHLPVQSGSNRVLKRMNRLYTKEDFMEKIKILRRANPNLALSTDIIVSFPGETDDDFQQTVALMEEVRFDNSYRFAYSPRPGTPALNLLKDEIDPKIRYQRLQKVNEIQEKITFEINQRKIGETVEVLVEKPNKKVNGYIGRTPDNKSVILPFKENVLGKFFDVKILSTKGFDLFGAFLNPAPFPKFFEKI